MKYKVWFGEERRFDTLAEAIRYAGFIFRKTGLIVAVTAVNK